MNNTLQVEQELFKHESAIFERMRIVGKKLNIMVVEPILRLSLVDGKTGKEKWLRERHSHSYVRNMFVKSTLAPTVLFEGTGYSDGNLAFKRTSGVSYTAAFPQDSSPEGGGGGYYHTASGQDDFGILVGRDSTAESFDDFEMINKVTDGNGPNQLEYIAMTISEGWNAGSSYYWSQFTAPFDNDSGAGVTVYEVGLVYRFGAIDILDARDIDAGGILVPNTDRLFVQYEIRTGF